jgi:hypothetical protein
MAPLPFSSLKPRIFDEKCHSLHAAAVSAQRVTRQRRLALSSPEGSEFYKPADVVEVIKQCARPNVGLLWQPTFFNHLDFTHLPIWNLIVASQIEATLRKT